MRCATGWGRIFTTGLTIMGFAFSIELLEWVSHFQIFGVRELFTVTVSKFTRILTVGEK